MIGKALHKNQRLSKKNGTKREIKKTTKTRERMCPRWVSRSSSINGISCVTLVKNPAESHELGEAGIVIITRVIFNIGICRTELIHDLSITLGS